MKRVLKLLFISISIVFYLSSCITSKQTNLMQDIDKSEEYAVIPPPEEYRIIPGDQLKIVVYFMDDKEGEEDTETKNLFSLYRPNFTRAETETHGINQNLGVQGFEGSPPTTVYADGTIKFPYIGKIHVADLTLLEARRLITSRLQALSSNITANVALYNGYFSVIGEIGARRVALPSTNITIYQALTLSGTGSLYSDKSKVRIVRQTKDGSVLKTFDLRSKDIINTEFYYIQPNDVIYFPQIKTKFLGATNSFLGFTGIFISMFGVIIMAISLF